MSTTCIEQNYHKDLLEGCQYMVGKIKRTLGVTQIQVKIQTYSIHCWKKNQSKTMQLSIVAGQVICLLFMTMYVSHKKQTVKLTRNHYLRLITQSIWHKWILSCFQMSHKNTVTRRCSIKYSAIYNPQFLDLSTGAHKMLQLAGRLHHVH